MRYFVNLQIHFFDENSSHQYLKSKLSGIVEIAPHKLETASNRGQRSEGDYDS